MLRRRVVTALCALAAVSWAAADPVPRLIYELGNARSFKVRVQAANILGRIKDPRALQALVRAAANDPHPAVRGVSVRILARSRFEGDQARLAISRALGDRDPSVRRGAAASMAELQRPSAAGPRGGPTVVAVGAIGDRTGRSSRAVRERLRAEIRALIGREPRVRLAEMGMPGVGYIVDASISKLEFGPSAMNVEATCGVQLVVSRPPRGIITVASGEATVSKLQRYYKAAAREEMETEALQAAVKGAHENLARFLATAQ